MKPTIQKNNGYIEIIGHYDNPVLCAKLTLLADLYAVEHKEGYAKFKIEDEDKLKLVDSKLLFPPVEARIYIDNNFIICHTNMSFEDQAPFTTDNQGYALYNGKRFYLNGVAVLGVNYPTAYANYYTINDLTGYTWVGNEQINATLFRNFNVNFNSNNFLYNILCLFTDDDGEYIQYNDTIVYDLLSSPRWFSEYKTIQITGGTDVTNATLISWLVANGTLTAPTPTGTNNVSIGTLKLAKALVGSDEISQMWLGNVKIYEK